MAAERPAAALNDRQPGAHLGLRRRCLRGKIFLSGNSAEKDTLLAGRFRGDAGGASPAGGRSGRSREYCCQTVRVTEAGLPELDIARVRRWCQQRVPEHVRSQVKVECDVTPLHLTIVECRPPWRQDMSAEWTRFPIARLRYTKATRQWSLYWRDRHLRFHLYDRITSSARIDDLLREIDCDPTAIFWG